MSLVIRWTSTGASFDGTTDVSDLAPYARDPADDGSFLCVLPPGTPIGRVTPSTVIRAAADTLGDLVVPKIDQLQRRFGVAVDDFALLQAIGSPSPNVPLEFTLAERTTQALERMVATPAIEVGADAFHVREQLQTTAPVIVHNGQGILVDDIEEEPPLRNIELVLFLEPLDNPRDYVQVARRAQLSRDISLLDQEMETQDFVNTVAESALYSGVIPPFAMGRNGFVRAQVLGDYLNASANPTGLIIRVRFGATIIFEDTIAAIPADAARRPFLFDFHWINQNDLEVQTGGGKCWLGPPTAAAVGTADFNTVPTIGGPFLLADQTQNLEQGGSLIITIENSVADPNVSFRKRASWVELVHRNFVFP